MNRDNYVALRAARDAASEEHTAAIRWAINRIGRLEKNLHEVAALARALRRAADYSNLDSGDDD